MPWVKKVVPATTNNLTQAVINFLLSKGHLAMRINTEGQFEQVSPIDHNFRIIAHHAEALRAFGFIVGRFRKIPDDEKGKSDIFCILKPTGKLFAIEIKFGDDKLSKYQKVWQEKAKECGAIILPECGEYQQFLDFYDKEIKPLI